MSLINYREQATFENIKSRMLAEVDPKLDRREGSLIYNSIAATASELEQLYIALQGIIEELDPDTASMEGLKLLALPYGLYPKQATPAQVICRFGFKEGKEVDLSGYTFTAENELEYTVTTRRESGNYLATCEKNGETGNIYYSDLVPKRDVDGLESAQIEGIYELGEDDETESAFRQRLSNAMLVRPFAGNIDYYRQTLLAMNNIGAVQVYPVWDGPGTVCVVVVNNSYRPFDARDLMQIQALVDPTYGNSGSEYVTGTAIAPIDHKVMVSTPREVKLNISMTVKGDFLTDSVREAINEYIEEVKAEWGEPDDFGKYELTIYKQKLIAKVLNVQGVRDVTSYSVNDIDGNLVLCEEINPSEGKQPEIPAVQIINVIKFSEI
ncbi:MAG: baseplate J/gp47 family protein [Clostridia bacterium]|nr:baseplate J/gp47 family protein [Clostridia bacterium]